MDSNKDIPNKMKLPKVSESSIRNNKASLLLERKILSAIKDVKKELNYELKSFEIDFVLLQIISRHHSSYVRQHIKENEQKT